MSSKFSQDYFNSQILFCNCHLALNWLELKLFSLTCSLFMNKQLAVITFFGFSLCSELLTKSRYRKVCYNLETNSGNVFEIEMFRHMWLFERVGRPNCIHLMPYVANFPNMNTIYNNSHMCSKCYLLIIVFLEMLLVGDIQVFISIYIFYYKPPPEAQRAEALPR